MRFINAFTVSIQSTCVVETLDKTNAFVASSSSLVYLEPNYRSFQDGCGFYGFTGLKLYKT